MGREERCSMGRTAGERDMRLQIGKEDRQTTETLSVGASLLVLLEVFVATLIVVGLFDAVFQPWGWLCVLQIVLCGVLGALLWLADGSLQQITAANTADASASPTELSRESLL
jgi:hypothetical protein